MNPKKDPLVTIVTLTYKNFDNIYNTISSVFEQNYDEIEYFVSDDGSPFFPENRISEYMVKNAPKNIKYQIICNKMNVGTVKHINSVYKIAKGTYIIPLSCGDEFTSPDTVAQIVKRFNEKKSEIVCAARCLVDKRGNMIRNMPCKLYYYKIRKLNTAEMQHKAFMLQEFYEIASGSSTYIKKELWEAMGGFDEKYRLWEDGPFYEKITGRGVCIDFAYKLCTIRYLVGGVSNGANINPMLKQDVLNYNEDLLDRIDYLGLTKFEKRKLKL